MLIGPHMRINPALDAIQFDGAVPICEHRGYMFLISTKGRVRGHLIYTMFEMDLKTSIHTVHLPYSTAHTLGEVLDRGEGLFDKLPPEESQLPPESYTIVSAVVKPIIKFY
jgi:hypothetical protein